MATFYRQTFPISSFSTGATDRFIFTMNGGLTSDAPIGTKIAMRAYVENQPERQISVFGTYNGSPNGSTNYIYFYMDGSPMTDAYHESFQTIEKVPATAGFITGSNGGNIVVEYWTGAGSIPSPKIFTDATSFSEALPVTIPEVVRYEMDVTWHVNSMFMFYLTTYFSETFTGEFSFKAWEASLPAEISEFSGTINKASSDAFGMYRTWEKGTGSPKYQQLSGGIVTDVDPWINGVTLNGGLSIHQIIELPYIYKTTSGYWTFTDDYGSSVLSNNPGNGSASYAPQYEVAPFGSPAPAAPVAPTIVDQTIQAPAAGTGIAVFITQGGTSGSSAFDESILLVQDPSTGSWEYGTFYLPEGDIYGGTNPASIYFVPSASFSGSLPIKVKAKNLQGLESNEATITFLSVSAEPTGPTANPDTITTPFDTPVTFYPHANDTAGTGAIDASLNAYDDGMGGFSQLVNVPGGFISASSDGSSLFTPGEDYSGSFQLAYRITDVNGLTSTSTISFTVEAYVEPTPPTANPDTITTAFETAVTFDPLVNDVPGNKSAMDASSVLFDFGGSQVAGYTDATGTYSVAANGWITYTPATDYVGNPAPIYTVAGLDGLRSNPAQISIVVQSPQGPTGHPDFLVTPYGTTIEFQPAVNDEEGDAPFDLTQTTLNDGNGNFVKIFTNASGSYSVASTTGLVTFVPAEGYSGTQIFEYEIVDMRGLAARSTVSITVEPFESVPPSLTPVALSTPYETPVKFYPLNGQNAGTGGFNGASLRISRDGVEKIVQIQDDTGEWVVDVITDPANPSITFTPADGRQGPSKVISFTAENIHGDAGNFSTISVEIGDEPPYMPPAISPLVRPRWVFGNFQSGLIEGTINYIDDNASLDIYGNDDAQVTIPLYDQEGKTSWAEKYEAQQKFIALISEQGQCVFAGPVLKHSPDWEKEQVTLIAVGFKRYLKQRFLVQAGKTAITSTEETWKITGGTPRTVASDILKELMDDPHAPKSVKWPARHDGEYSFEAPLAELRNGEEVMDEISQDFGGVELRWIPVVSDDGTKIVWEFIGGEPHIGDSGVPEIVIPLDNSTVLPEDGYSRIDDYGTAANRFWLQVNTETGLDLTAQQAPLDPSKVVWESKEKIDATLTAAQKTEQFNARINSAGKGLQDNSLKVKDNGWTFYGALGRRAEVIGEGRSFGLGAIVRIIGVSLTTKKNYVTLNVSNLQRVYPALPKSIVGLAVDKAMAEMDNDWKLSDMSAMSGESPWNPGDGDGSEWTEDGLWGDVGHSPDEPLPGDGINPGADLVEYQVTQLGSIPFEGGLKGIVPETIQQTSGNRIYGLSSIIERFDSNPNYNLPHPNSNPSDVFFRTSYFQNGGVGSFITAGKIAGFNIAQYLDTLPEAADIRTIRTLKYSFYISIDKVLMYFLDSAEIHRTLYDGNGNVSGTTIEYRPKAFTLRSDLGPTGNVVGNWLSTNPLPNYYWVSPYSWTKFADVATFIGGVEAYTKGTINPSANNPMPRLIREMNFQSQKTTAQTGNWIPLQVLPGDGDPNFMAMAFNKYLYITRLMPVTDTQTEPNRGRKIEIMRIATNPDGTLGAGAVWEKVHENTWSNRSTTSALGICSFYLIFKDADSASTGLIRLKRDGTWAESTVTGPFIGAHEVAPGIDYDYSSGQFLAIGESNDKNACSKIFSYKDYVYYLQGGNGNQTFALHSARLAQW